MNAFYLFNFINFITENTKWHSGINKINFIGILNGIIIIAQTAKVSIQILNS